MALRWSKTLGAYNKYKYLFSKSLPIFIPLKKGQIAKATYIRDVIAYAKENNLPGGEWYKRIRVSPKDDGVLVFDTQKKALKLPEESLFSLIKKADTLKSEYAFVCTQPETLLNKTLEPLGIKVRSLKTHFVVV